MSRGLIFLIATIMHLAVAIVTTPSIEAHANQGGIYIDVGEARVKKSLIAIPSFLFFGAESSNEAYIRAGQEIFKVMMNDLTVSGFFSFIKPEAFLEDPNKTGLRPAPQDPKGFNFNSWKTIGAEFLIRGGYKIIDGQISLEIYLYHVGQAKQILGKTYQGPISATRDIAHTFCNDILYALTNKKGIFKTKIVTSFEIVKPLAGGKETRYKEIAIMDWDGFGFTQVSSHNSVAISPAWSPDGKKILYTAFAYHTRAKTRNADLFNYELATGKRWLLSYRKGVNSGGTYLPDGRAILLTLTEGKGKSDIFRMTLDGKSITPLTRGPGSAMNVEPAVSPDGKTIFFSSDRAGQPMIYSMGIDGELGGNKATRLTLAGRYNSSPAVSPDGKKIAFASFDKGHFDLFVMNVDKTALRRLTSAKRSDGTWANNENPSWSPDGRYILFTSDRDSSSKLKRNQIYLIAADGSNERRLTYDNKNYFQPRWSPFLDN